MSILKICISTNCQTQSQRLSLTSLGFHENVQKQRNLLQKQRIQAQSLSGFHVFVLLFILVYQYAS